MAVLYMGLGDKEQAITALQKGYEDRNNQLILLGSPEFDPLKSDPRYQDLLRRIGLTPWQ